jgi:cytochrome b6-f complex iron-sulfur subunit
MERQEFLSKLGIGLVAVCAGCSLVSCGGGSKGNDPVPTPAPTPPATGSGNLFTADLTSELMNIGDSKVEQGIILVRIGSDETANSFTAVQVACTHQGNAIAYNTNQGIFICPAHGSEFSKSGQVVLGPAASPLHKYTVTINNSILTVTA